VTHSQGFSAVTTPGRMAGRRVLVRAPNWLGDIVMALPAMASVRRHFADATLAVAAPSAFAPLCAAIEGVDEVIGLPNTRLPRQIGVHAEALAAGRFDTAILLTNSFASALAVHRAGIPERWGYRTDWRGRLLTRAVPRRGRKASRGVGLHLPTDAAAGAATDDAVDAATAVTGAAPLDRHHSRYYLTLLDALGLPASASMPAVRVSGEARARAADLLRAGGYRGDEPLIGVAPGAAYGHAKRWPPELMADVIARLARTGARVVLLGASADRPTASAIESALADRPRTAADGRGAAIDLVGRTDLPGLMAVLQACRVVLSNDSGAMHVASAVGTPVVALFGPTDDRATAPLGPHRVVSHPVWCRPCLLRECPLDHACMRGITPDRVFDEVNAWIDRTNTHIATHGATT